MKRLRTLVATLALSTSAAAVPVAVHAASASSPYGCAAPSGWGERVCYQIAGYGSYVYMFQGEVDNYWSFTIYMSVTVTGPGGTYYAANIPVAARSKHAWVVNEYRNLPTGRYCATYGSSSRYSICYSVL